MGGKMASLVPGWQPTKGKIRVWVWGSSTLTSFPTRPWRGPELSLKLKTLGIKMSEACLWTEIIPKKLLAFKSNPIDVKAVLPHKTIFPVFSIYKAPKHRKELKNSAAQDEIRTMGQNQGAVTVAWNVKMLPTELPSHMDTGSSPSCSTSYPIFC